MQMVHGLISKYIKYKEGEDGCSPQTIIRYKYLLDVYGRFLCTSSPDEATLISKLRKATSDHLFDALTYYIDWKKIRAEDTCDIYISVVRGFLQFLWKQNIVTNDPLIISFNHNMPDDATFTTQYKAFKKKLKEEKKIKYSSKALPLEESVVAKLLNQCRDHYSKFINVAKKNERHYQAIMNPVMVRLVIYAGLSQRAIASLDLQSYHSNTKSLIVKGVEIKLDDETNSMLLGYKSVRSSFVSNSPLLFFKANGKTIENAMGSFLGNKLETNDKAGSVIAVSKYAIIKMLQSNIGVGFIRKITDYDDEVIAPCIELSEIGRESEYIESLFQLAWTF